MAKLSDLKQDGFGGHVQVSYQSDVAIITMDRGENRINGELLDQLNAAFDEVLSKPQVKAIITTGRGKFYSNGLDLKWLMELGAKFPDDLTKFIGRWGEFQIRLITCPVPTVAAINGHCYAGGAVISLCHDYQVMNNERGWWCMNEVRLGMNIPVWIIQMFKLKHGGSGGKHLLDILVCGKKYTADEAKSCGIVNETGLANELISKAVSIVNSRVVGDVLDRSFVQTTKENLYSEILKEIKSRKESAVSPKGLKSQL